MSAGSLLGQLQGHHPVRGRQSCLSRNQRGPRASASLRTRSSRPLRRAPRPSSSTRRRTTAGSVVTAQDLEAHRPRRPRSRVFFCFWMSVTSTSTMPESLSPAVHSPGPKSIWSSSVTLENLLDDRLARGFALASKSVTAQPEQAAVAIHFECHQHRAEAAIAALTGSQHSAWPSFAPSSLTCATTCWPRSKRFPASPAPSRKGRSTCTPTSRLTSARAAFARPPSWPRGCSTRPRRHCAGEAFGTAEHIRISYPVTKQNIDEGTRRMGEFLTGLK